MKRSYVPSIENIIFGDIPLSFKVGFQSSYIQAAIEYLREFNQSFQNRK